METKKVSFIPQLNTLRFLAAIFVVVFHFGRWSHPFDNYLQKYDYAMTLAVSFFFVLSGFIMTVVYKNLDKFSFDNAKKFYKKRINKIVPLYIIALFAVCIEYLLIKPATFEFSIKYFLENLFFVQAWVPKDALSLNFPGWSLSVEMFFYFLFPFLLPILIKNKNAFKFIFVFWLLSNIIFLLFCFNLNLDNVAELQFLKYFPLLHLNQFLIGIGAGVLYLKSKYLKWGNIMFVVGIIFLAIYFTFFTGEFFVILNHNGLLAPIFALIILGASYSTSIIKKILSYTWLVRGGDASYGIYILQFPVYLAIYKIYKRLGVYGALGEEYRFYIYLILLIIISYLFYFVLEVYLRNKFKN